MDPLSSEERATKAAPAGTRSMVPLWFWAAAAVLFFFMVLEVWDARILREEMRTVNEHAATEMQKRQELQRELALLHRERKILTDTSSVKIPLQGQSPEQPMEATWQSGLGIIVTGQKITPPGEGRALQLWLIPKAARSKPVPSLAMRPDADGRYFLMVADPPEAMSDTKALAITEEPAGGSAQPTTAPKWMGGIFLD